MDLSFLAYAILASLLLLTVSFFNFVSSLYSDIDISKVDLSRVSRKRKKIKKLIYVIKNSYFLFVGTSVLSVIFNAFISRIIFVNLGAGTNLVLKNWLVGLIIEILTVLFLAFLTEIVMRYFAEREFAKRRILNSFLLTSACSITRAAAWPLRWIIKEKKLSPYREQDLIRLMGNLEAENILEPQEVRLLRAAFNFDEETIEKHYKPRKKVIFLSTEMSLEEIHQIYFKYHYTRYPVLSKERKLIGILNFKTLSLKMKDKEKEDWRKFIEKKINYLNLSTKLNAAFETCQKYCQHLAIVVDEKGQIIGIITLEDIIETLVGTIQDENEVSSKKKKQTQ